MINRFSRWALGYRIVRAAPENKNEVLDVLISAGVLFWALKQEEDGSIVFRVAEKYVKKLLEWRNVRGGKIITPVRSCGIPHYLRKYHLRAGIAVAIIFMIAFWGLSAQFVWEIKVIGNTKTPTEKVLSRLSDCGLQLGSYLGSLDFWSIQDRYLIGDKSLEWISINRQGTVVYVQMKEQKYDDPVADENDGRVSVLCADCVGVVKWTEVMEGEVKVTYDQQVEKGEPLITGLEETKDGTYRMHRAKGKVYAQTYYPITVEIPLVQEQKQYTGDAITKKDLVFFGKPVKLFANYGNLPAVCDTIDKKEQFFLPGGAELPIALDTHTFLPYHMVTLTLTQEQASVIGEATLEDRISRELEDAEIESIQTKVSVDSEKLTIHCTVECIRDICEEKFLTFAEYTESIDGTQEMNQ